ncbi:hypothetical protein MLD38_006518 [Melastoma candidum]|uniref:Uncharacterized protein n=1 Tax=Melastoma candidum TaxID=119954 RepID=A0ACB9RSB9_9MYRT|nr:hypothetical protein MLD38_006518 [Melastoma candidum]
MASASAVVSPLVAACISASGDRDGTGSFPGASSSTSSSKKWRKRDLTSFHDGGSLGALTVSSLCGSGVHGLNPSSLALVRSDCFQGWSFPGFLVGSDDGGGFVGLSSCYFGGRRRKMHPASRSGTAVAMQPTQGITEKKQTTKQRRVVVTGMGVVTPLGHDPDVFYNNLLDGNSGISEIEAFDCAQFPTRIAGEIKSFSPEGWVSPKLSKRMDKFMLYMLTAGKKALADGGITDEANELLDIARCGILIGSAMGGMKLFNDAIEAARISYKKISPFCVPFSPTNMGSAILAMDLGWRGPNYSISTACATSNFCIMNAANHISRDEADMMLCGGSDATILPIAMGGFAVRGSLSRRNDNPTKASRPWDVMRDGFVIGEGAGVLLLEELEHAKKRGAEIYSEFLGGSSTCYAYDLNKPHPAGSAAIHCIEKALSRSGVSREDVNFVNAHAMSTPAGDLNEYQALMHCFGDNKELKVNSTKSMVGHLLGASGGIAAVAVIQAIRTGWIHPNINLENPDKGLDTSILVGSKKERLDVKVAMSNSFGFGGHNSSLLFAPYK